MALLLFLMTAHGCLGLSLVYAQGSKEVVMLRVYLRNLTTGEEEVVPDDEFQRWEGKISSEQWEDIQEGDEVILALTHGETDHDPEPLFEVVARDE